MLCHHLEWGGSDADSHHKCERFKITRVCILLCTISYIILILYFHYYYYYYFFYYYYQYTHSALKSRVVPLQGHKQYIMSRLSYYSFEDYNTL